MRTLILLVCLSLGLPINAMVVEVVGSAPMNGAMSYVREQAMQDAMQQAVLRAGMQISSTQLMSKGVIEQDEVRIQGKGQLSDVKILWEEQKEGVYEIAIRAEVDSQKMCPKSVQHYRKSVAITGFNLAKPAQASIGQLQNIEHDLPHLLVNSLNNKGLVQALDASQYSLYPSALRAPTANRTHLTSSATVATELGTQYVVSGVVRDLSILDTNKHKPSWRARVGLPEASQPRQFVLDIYVHDGLSGALLFQRSYSTMGEWDINVKNAVGFASPEFWQSKYGNKVRDVMSNAVADVNEALRCQPFMARIVKTEGERLYIEAKGTSGIRPGDKFKVYRTGTFYNLDLEPRTELANMATEVVVTHVQPQFIIAELPFSGSSLAIQRDDMVVAW